MLTQNWALTEKNQLHLSDRNVLLEENSSQTRRDRIKNSKKDWMCYQLDKWYHHLYEI